MADKVVEVTPVQTSAEKQKSGLRSWLEDKRRRALETRARVVNTMPEALEKKREAESVLERYQQTEDMKKWRAQEAAGGYSAPRTKTLEEQRKERYSTLPTKNAWDAARKVKQGGTSR